jgi:uncharacterized protein (DUF58 family)
MVVGELELEDAKVIGQFTYLLKDFPLIKKAYKIFFRGKSFDFESFRDYVSGDDASSIDWVASARGSKLLVRQFREQENPTIIFAVDVGDVMLYGSDKKLKCEYAAEIALAIAYLNLGVGNRVGFFLYSDKVKLFSPPKRGKRTFYAFRDALINGKNYGGSSNLSDALEFLLSLPPYAAASAVLLSDFSSVDGSISEKLTALNSRYESISLMIRDKIDISLPNVSGEFVLQDKSGEQIIINPRLAKKSYGEYIRKKEIQIREIFKSKDIDLIDFVTDEPAVETLVTFLRGRVKRRGVKI